MTNAREQLAGELRRLRELSGRSLKDLEAETHASDSSLSRYLSGRTLPPWTVVEGLSRSAGRDPAELRPLWTAAGTNSTAAAEPTPRATGVRWRQAIVFLAVGALLGVAVTRIPEIASWPSHRAAGTDGPHFSVTLMETARSHRSTAIWSFNARCGNADEYRLVYDLPISVQRRATAYRVDHADCTIKLFDGIGGSGIGEPLANDHRSHPVPPRLNREGSSIVAYSCCNGTILSRRR